ncbi:MAG: hypothetical protein ACREMX_14165 [Gemmatimonadales bacterium]
MTHHGLKERASSVPAAACGGGSDAKPPALPEVQRVPGLGSAALWDATNHVLLVRPTRPGTELNVQPYLGTKVPMIELPQARAVAEAALQRLQ